MLLGCVGGGSRMSMHIRECDHHHYIRMRLGLELYGSRVAHLYSSPQSLQRQTPPPSVIHSKSPGEDIPVLSTLFRHLIKGLISFFSQSRGDSERDASPEGLPSVAGGVVALGKFDALHIGHRELAIQASKVGPPFLLSFVGMAEVLGWEPRAPIVAKCDRNRVLSSWASYCGNVNPAELQIDFSSVRHLTPREFVEKLSKDLKVRGVVAGENYRFGYKAAGDASELVRLCEENGLGAYIINSVMDKKVNPINTISRSSKDIGQVSSTRVRRALAVGDIKYVSELLGRQHRLILMAPNQELFSCTKNKVLASKYCLLNLAPKEGLYDKCSLFIADGNVVPCRIVIDKAYIHIEPDGSGICRNFGPQDLKLLRIEFGNSQL